MNIVITIDKKFYKKLYFIGYCLFGFGLGEISRIWFPQYSYEWPIYGYFLMPIFIGILYAIYTD